MKILLIIVIILLILYFTSVMEGFDDYNPNIMGREHGDEYRNITYNTNDCLWQTHQFKGQQWYTRFPYMINVRYDYNDTPLLNDPNTTITPYGYLNQLPLVGIQSCNKKIPYRLQLNSTEYYPIGHCDYCWRYKGKIKGYDYETTIDDTGTGDPTPDDYHVQEKLWYLNNKKSHAGVHQNDHIHSI